MLVLGGIEVVDIEWGKMGGFLDIQGCWFLRFAMTPTETFYLIKFSRYRKETRKVTVSLFVTQ